MFLLVLRGSRPHLCSITLVLGMSFQNWARSWFSPATAFSISAAITRKRS